LSGAESAGQWVLVQFDNGRCDHPG
jgi:hypothetical protein